MNILLIGNGFDIAHDLPTQYDYFLKFTKAFDECNGIIEYYKLDSDLSTAVPQDDIDWYDEFIKYFQKIYYNNRPLFDELKDLIKDNCWLRHFYNVQIKQNWIDFESEISKVIQTLDDVRKEFLYKKKSGERCFHLLDYQKEVLRNVGGDWYGVSELNSIISLKETLLKDLNKLTRCLEIYLSDYVAGLPINKKLPDICDKMIDNVLSFNYTNTYDKVYNEKGAKKIEYDFIHGEAKVSRNVNTCNLVLGIDEYLEEPEKDLDNEFIQFKKFFQRIFKGTGNEYEVWLEKTQRSAANHYKAEEINLYIYGHSLDVTDKDILEKLLLNEKVTATIYYHSQKALGDLIANLVKVIGQDELIKRTGGVNRKIRFEEIKSTK